MWYRTGTIAVQTGSATVSGSGTAWVENVRVGDGLQGPDGRLYEITNVASNTALSITPAYRGTNASGQGYWIIPVQGYTKRLADKAADLVSEYGDAKDKAESAVQPDDLGSAAAADLMSSPTDATAGRVLTVGAFGWGDSLPLLSGSADNLLTPASYFVTADAVPGLPAGTAYTMVVSAGKTGSTTNRATQEFQAISAGGTIQNRKFIRSWTGSTWTPLTEVWTSSSLPPQTDWKDVVPDRLLRVGGLGLGRTIPVTDMNSVDGQTTAPYFGFLHSDNAANRPDGASTNFCTVLRMSPQASQASGRASELFIDTEADRFWFRRRGFSPNWGPYREIWHAGNLQVQANIYDTTPNSAMLRGAFGLGEISGRPFLSTALETCFAAGFYGIKNTAPDGPGVFGATVVSVLAGELSSGRSGG